MADQYGTYDGECTTEKQLEAFLERLEVNTEAPRPSVSGNAPERFSEPEIDALYEKAKAFKEHNLARGDREQGTKFSGICFHCSHHFAYRTRDMNEPIVLCQAMPGRARPLPLNIIECSDYKRVTDMGLRDMAMIALPIDTRDYLKDGYR